jgi:serine/threonine protein kinase
MSSADDIKTTIIDASNIKASPVSKEPREIIRHLGEGGMGEVFLCLNPLFDAEDPQCKEPKTVAVNTLSPDLMQDKEVLKRFEAEAKALSPIQHRNVVRLYDWGKFTDGAQVGQHYISMEFIEGLSLHKLGRLRRLSFPDVIDIAIQVCEGLDAVHKHGVIHRDLKPANIMITHDGVAKIIDFGIAKPSSLGTNESDLAERGFKTKTGMIIGTVNYLAPETLLGAQASVQTDLYAVGLIIWEIINGATPFKTASLAETMRRVSEESLTWSDAALDIAPPGFIKLINQITSKDPQKRPASAAELVQKLLKVRADAQWPALLNRKSRLDLNVMWSSDLLEK